MFLLTVYVIKTLVEIDPAKNTALEGLYLSSGNYCTQCEAEGFRKITYYLDRPDVMAILHCAYRSKQTAAFLIMLSNGNRVATGDLSDGRHFAEWNDPLSKA